ncbi:hypothetical protein ACFS7Z_01630 [Pontibacter toksunensis]|uniref:Uncharacterized protein n=1 Tax=Pontibacter toksunensis TaxID=1332631 RepID=A0ABW6BQ59_9BACT
MRISLNYKFLLQITGWLVGATAVLIMLLMQVLEHHEGTVPLWGQKSASTDLLIFSPALAFLTGLVATKLTHRALLRKKVLPLHWHLKSQTLIDRLPGHILHRAFMLSLAGGLVAGIILMLCRLRRIEQITYQEYLGMFFLHSVSLAGAITVMAVYRALGDYQMLKEAKAKKQSTST